MANRLNDIVRVMDRGVANLRSKAAGIIGGRYWGEEKSVIEVQGWVKLLMRERGKIVPGSHREGHMEVVEGWSEKALAYDGGKS